MPHKRISRILITVSIRAACRLSSTCPGQRTGFAIRESTKPLPVANAGGRDALPSRLGPTDSSSGSFRKARARACAGARVQYVNRSGDSDNRPNFDRLLGTSLSRRGEGICTSARPRASPASGRFANRPYVAPPSLCERGGRPQGSPLRLVKDEFDVLWVPAYAGMTWLAFELAAFYEVVEEVGVGF